MVCLVFSGNAAAQSHSNSIMDGKVAGLVGDVKKWWDVEKAASERTKKAEKQAAKAEEARRKAEGELSSVRSEHSRYRCFLRPSTRPVNKRLPTSRAQGVRSPSSRRV